MSEKAKKPIDVREDLRVFDPKERGLFMSAIEEVFNPRTRG